MTCVLFRGATSWEGQVGRFWFRWPFWTYLKLGIWPTVGWDTVGWDTDEGTEMTVDTEAKAIEFLTAARLEFFRTGSREICDPAPTNTDVDFVTLIDPSRRLPEQYDETFEKAGFRRTSADHSDTYGSSANFETYRCGEVNLIVVWDRFHYNNWRGATSITKRLNLIEKEHRIALFQGVLYCNWNDWLVLNHTQEF